MPSSPPARNRASVAERRALPAHGRAPRKRRPGRDSPHRLEPKPRAGAVPGLADLGRASSCGGGASWNFHPVPVPESRRGRRSGRRPMNRRSCFPQVPTATAALLPVRRERAVEKMARERIQGQQRRAQVPRCSSPRVWTTCAPQGASSPPWRRELPMLRGFLRSGRSCCGEKGPRHAPASSVKR